MEANPPHRFIPTRRDIFTCIGIITISLLIALGFKSLAEFAWHRHLRHQAEDSLLAEMRENRNLLVKNEVQLRTALKQYTNNLRILAALRDRSTVPAELAFNWYWSDFQSAAWNTARDTGALSLMPYAEAQEFSSAYMQQDIVNRQSEIYVAETYRIGSPLEGRKLADLKPAEIDAMIITTQQTLADIERLHDLCSGLDTIYSKAAREQ